jgi:hypothetical protein
MKKAFYFIFLLALIHLSCKKEEATTYYDPYPVKATAKMSVYGLQIDWKAPKSSDLIGYKIWKSFGTDSLKEDKIAFNARLIESFNGINVNTYVTTFHSYMPEFEVDTYYKVEAILKDRSVWSANIKVNYKPQLVYNDKIDLVLTDHVDKKMYFFAEKTGLLSLFDPEKGQLENVQTRNQNLNRIYLTYCFGNHNGVRELYLLNYRNFYIYDAKTLTLIKSIEFKETFSSIATNNNGILYMQSSESPRNLHVFDRSTLSTLNTYSQPNEGILKYLPLQNRLLFVSHYYPQYLKYIELSSDGKSVTGSTPKTDLNSPTLNYGNLLYNTVSKDEENIIIGTFPAFYDKKLTQITAPTPKEAGNFGSIQFDPNSNTVHALNHTQHTYCTFDSKGVLISSRELAYFPNSLNVFDNNNKWVTALIGIGNNRGKYWVQKLP